MRWFLTVLFFVVAAFGTAQAQESAFRFASDPFSGDSAPESGTPTVREAGKYAEAATTESYKSWPNAEGRDAVQKKAMFRAEQRQLRMASRNWYGFSQSRPVVTAVPYMTDYSPLWVGRHWQPYDSWYGSVWR